MLEARDEAEQLLGVVDPASPTPSPTAADRADPPPTAAAAAASPADGADVKREVFGEGGSQPSASEPAAWRRRQLGSG